MIKNSKVPLTLNILLIVLFVIGIFLAVKEGIQIFEYYTEDSNILAGISSILYVYYVLKNKDEKPIPLWVSVLRYVATCSLTLTLIVVFAVLLPMTPGSYIDNMKHFVFEGSMLFFHLLCPVLSIFSFTIFEKDERLNKNKYIYYALIPTLIYGIILIILNVLKIVIGPYPFLMVYNQPWYMTIIWIVVIGCLNYIIAKTILFLNQSNVNKV